MSQESEPTASEYARLHDLAIDHRECNLLADLAHDVNLDKELKDGDDLFVIDDTFDFDLVEPLETGKDAAILLASIIDASQHSPTFEYEPGMDPHRFRNMKAEVPILKTDHETDMSEFAAPVVPDLANEHLPFESIDEEAGEGLGWPPEYYRLPDQFKAEAETGLLEVSQEALRYIQDALLLSANGNEERIFAVEELNYKTVRSINDYLLIALLLN